MSVSRLTGFRATLALAVAFAFTLYFFQFGAFFEVQYHSNGQSGVGKVLQKASRVMTVRGHTTNITNMCMTPHFQPDLVVYNRLPKAGSSSMTAILRNMSKTNQVQLEFSDRYGIRPSQRLDDPFLVRALNASSEGKPAIYVNHVHYLGEDFNDIAPSAPRPAYMQLVREPISRVISTFYYLKQASRGEGANKHMKDFMRGAGLDSPVYDIRECLETAKRPAHCTHNNGMTRYFCGHGQECSNISSPVAFATAASNLDRYLFVGLLEEFQLTLAMLEKLLPAYFRGAESIEIPQTNKGTKGKALLDDESLALIRTWNANDLALYDLIVERFKREVKACLDVSLTDQ